MPTLAPRPQPKPAAKQPITLDTRFSLTPEGNAALDAALMGRRGKDAQNAPNAPGTAPAQGNGPSYEAMPALCLCCGPFPAAYEVFKDSGRSYFPLCPACRARSAQARREREPRAALLRAQVEGMAAQGLTEQDLHTAARSGHDLFGIQALPEKVWVDWLLCMEGAANSLPVGHPLRSLLHAVRPTSNRVRTAFRRAQKAASLGEGRPLPRGRRINARGKRLPLAVAA